MGNNNTNAGVRIVDAQGLVHGRHGTLSYAMTVAGWPGCKIVDANDRVLAKYVAIDGEGWRCPAEVGAVRGDCGREPGHTGAHVLAWWCGGPR